MPAWLEQQPRRKREGRKKPQKRIFILNSTSSLPPLDSKTLGVKKLCIISHQATFTLQIMYNLFSTSNNPFRTLRRA